MTRRWKIFTAVGLLTIVADQLSKLWARGLPVDAAGRSIPVTVIDGFWDWRLAWNTGSAFGLFSSTSGARIGLTVVGLIALAAIFYMVKQARDDQRRLAFGFALVGGGAVGNLIDRIYLGRVTDFVVWKYGEHEWPTFNVADVALCVGVGLLFLDFGREAKAERAARAQAELDESSGKDSGPRAGAGKRKGARKKRR